MGKNAHVKAQHLVFGVVDDPDDLIRVQARVQSVQHTTRPAHPEVELQVAVAVPGQGGHTVAEGQVQTVQRIGDLAGTGGDYVGNWCGGCRPPPVAIPLLPSPWWRSAKSIRDGDQQLLALHQT